MSDPSQAPKWTPESDEPPDGNAPDWQHDAWLFAHGATFEDMYPGGDD